MLVDRSIQLEIREVYMLDGLWVLYELYKLYMPFMLNIPLLNMFDTDYKYLFVY